jgi:PAS domain S-box-containing protein
VSTPSVRNVDLPLPRRRMLAPISWVVLAVALVLTFFAWRHSQRDVEAEGRALFDDQVQGITSAIRERMDGYETVLRSAAALIGRSSPPTRDDWARLATSIDLDDRYPNIVALAFARRVPANEIDRHVAAMRAEGFTDYAVRPLADRDEYFPAVFLEPSTAVNVSLLGVDMEREPLRRAAGDRARDSGEIAASEPIQLIQDEGEPRRPAINMVYPVYRDLPRLPTVQQRRDALVGFALVALRIGPLLDSVMANRMPGVMVSLRDGDPGDGDVLAVAPSDDESVTSPLYHRTVRVVVGGRTWTLRFTSGPRFDATLHHDEPFGVLAVGLVLSVLLFAAVRTQASAEARSFALATEMTSKLRDRETRLQAILDGEPECVKTVGRDGRVLQMNPAGLAMVGAESGAQVIGRSVFELVHPQDRAANRRLHEQGADGGMGRRTYRAIGLGGDVRWMETTSVPLRDDRGDTTAVLSVTREITERKNAEDRLKETTAVLEAILHAVPDMFFLVGDDGKILDYRGGGETDMLVAPAQFLGRRFADVLPSPVASRLSAALELTHQTRKPRTVEYALTLPHGEETFEARVLPFGNDRTVVVARNITERTRTENALRASEERYRQIVDTASEGIWTIDAQHRTTYVNRRMAEMLRCQPDEVIGRSLFDFLEEEHRDLARSRIELHTEPARQYEDVRYVRPDGTAFWAIVSTRPIFDDAGNYAGALGMITDVTKRRAAEGAQRDAESLMRSIIEHSPNMMFVKDAEELRFVLCNRAFEDILGYRQDEVIGKNDYDFFPASADFFTSKDREVLSSGRLLQIPEETVQTRQRGLRYLRTLKVPIVDADGRPQYLLGIAEDITDRKQLEAQLRQAQKMEAVGTLAGGIAHDFNNILTSIVGFGELARVDSAGNPRAVESIENVLEAGHRAKSLVEQLVAFSRRQEPVRYAIDPGDTISAALKLVRAALPTSIAVRADIAPDLPTVLADPTQMHQVAMNLATNAAHAMGHRQGEIDVALRRTTVTHDVAATQLALSPGDYVCLTVRDTGCGMDAATIERIFDPFFTTKPKGQGTGLGLSVVHGIVQSHGGAIVVRSAPGAGTTFEVYLPAHDGPVAPQDPTDANVVPRGRGERILFVDDEAQIAELGRSMLESLGYRVTSFTDPVVAATMFRAAPDGFDLVVTDLTMPSLSGTELAAELWRVRPDMPILLDTGFIGGMTADAARAAGLRGVLAKPYTLSALGRAVHQALSADV